MLRKTVQLLAVLMICMPIGEALAVRWLGRFEWPLPGGLDGPWWLGPRELLICTGCLLVLTLTDCRRRRLAMAGLDDWPGRG